MAENLGPVIRPYAMVGGLFRVNDSTPFPWQDRVPPNVGDVLTASDPEPGHWVTVRDANGRLWRRTDDGDRDGVANWEKTDVDYFEPESWTRVCEAGPVTIMEVGDDDR